MKKVKLLQVKSDSRIKRIEEVQDENENKSIASLKKWVELMFDFYLFFEFNRKFEMI